MRSIACWMDCAARMRQRYEASLLWWQTGRRKNRTRHRRCIHSRIPRRQEDPRPPLPAITYDDGTHIPEDKNGALVARPGFLRCGQPPGAVRRPSFRGPTLIEHLAAVRRGIP